MRNQRDWPGNNILEGIFKTMGKIIKTLKDQGFSDHAIQHIVNKNNVVKWEWKPING